MSDTVHPREQLSAYLDGALTPAERAAVDTHLGSCADCRARLAELRGVSALLRSLPDPMPSRRLVPRLATVPVWIAPLRTLATLASGISGTTLHVDKGMHSMAVPSDVDGYIDRLSTPAAERP